MPPLARAAIVFYSGILLGLRWAGAAPAPSAPLLLAALIGLTSLFFFRRHQSWLLLGAFAATGFASGAGAAARERGDCRSRIPDASRLVVRGTFAARPAANGAAPFRLERIWARGTAVECTGQVQARLGRGRRAAPGVVAG
ncbi:MAG: hypothetical protein HY703_09705, partial [Gemmatimonadetes bacterium]|nr:hypothetical protein [Gemmatimonadota bacterium]